MYHIRLILFLILAAPSVSGLYSIASAEDVYQDPADFIKEVFQGSAPEASTIMLFGERRKVVAQILKHPPSMLRSRYWMKGNKSAWILEEIGKVKPITAGILVQDGLIEDVRVLVYRETPHGNEIRHKFFTRQFPGAKLTEANKLSQTINGISGATLSVNAMRKLATLALYLDKEARRK